MPSHLFAFSNGVIIRQSINCFLKPRPRVIITRDAKQPQGNATIVVRMECVVEKEKKEKEKETV